jgi:hypothetical protein
MRIFVGMTNTQASLQASSRTRSRPPTRSVPIPQTRPEASELRELLEAYLLAMQALLDEHRRMLKRSLLAVDGPQPDLLAELRALGDPRAPWVSALAETRALLYVALREVIVGDNEAGVSMHLPAPPEVEPQDRS